MTHNRWQNGKPIGERGGANLYRMVRGNPIHRIDVLGESPDHVAASIPNNSDSKKNIFLISKKEIGYQEQTQGKKC